MYFLIFQPMLKLCINFKLSQSSVIWGKARHWDKARHIDNISESTNIEFFGLSHYFAHTLSS